MVVVPGFDVVVAGVREGKAVVKQFTTTAIFSCQKAIQFTTAKGNVKLSGIAMQSISSPLSIDRLLVLYPPLTSCTIRCARHTVFFRRTGG